MNRKRKKSSTFGKTLWNKIIVKQKNDRLLCCQVKVCCVCFFLFSSVCFFFEKKRGEKNNKSFFLSPLIAKTSEPKLKQIVSITKTFIRLYHIVDIICETRLFFLYNFHYLLSLHSSYKYIDTFRWKNCLLQMIEWIYSYCTYNVLENISVNKSTIDIYCALLLF